MFREADICVPDDMSDVTSFSCAWSALRISSRSVLTCPGSFSATAAKRSTEAAICVEFETNCCTAGVSTALMLKKFRLPPQQHRHLLGHEEGALGKHPRLGNLAHGRVHAGKRINPEQAEHAAGFGLFVLAGLRDLRGETQRARRHQAFRQRIPAVPRRNRPAQFRLLLRPQHLPASSPDFRLGVPGIFQQGPGGFAENLGLPMFLQRHPRHRHKNGHVEQIGDGVRAGGDGHRSRWRAQFSFAGFRRESGALVPRRRLSTPMIMRVEYSSANRNSFCCTSTGSAALLVLFARRDGADGLTGNIRGALDEPAACAQGEEQEA